MKENKGFTLVELLAVIVILAIIMIIAIPSVLSTVETAKQKTMMEFYQKVLNAVERKYIEDSNFKNLPRPGKYQHYIYDIKKDLDIPSTGDFFGYAMASVNGSKVTYEVTLANENYVLYSESKKQKEVTPDDLIEREKMDEFYKNATAGEITNLNQITIDYYVKFIVDYTLCAGGDHDYYIEASTGRVVGHNSYKPEKWVGGECKDNNIWDILDSIR
jgi:prepilin-type N-terminal cleavage/methylation domain-containing protein